MFFLSFSKVHVPGYELQDSIGADFNGNDAAVDDDVKVRTGRNSSSPSSYSRAFGICLTDTAAASCLQLF